MKHNPLRLATPLLVCLFLPERGLTQQGEVPAYVKEANPYGGGTILKSGPRGEIGAYAGAPFGGPLGAPFGNSFGSPYGPGQWHSGWPYGPRTAPPWGYPGLWGGPFVGYPWGYYGYGPRAGSFWSNGLSLYGPPVPVYGPVPGVFGNNDLVRQWRAVPSAGIPFGWVGIYAASPRPRHLSVNVWPPYAERFSSQPFVGAGVGAGAGALPAPTPVGGGCLILSVKVPQPAAEVIVDGVKTMQTGTDRVFEAPPTPAGKDISYQVTVRWLERGAIHEQTRTATGTPGEVVRLDFTGPEIVTTSK